MGYYTDFTITTDSNAIITSLVCTALAEISGYEFEDGNTNAKWYDHEDHIAQVSKQFPLTLITVDGEGEESGDIWRLYARNGEFEKVEAKVTFAPCSFATQVTEYRTIDVSVHGVGIPVLIKCFVDTSIEDAYKQAKQALKDSL